MAVARDHVTHQDRDQALPHMPAGVIIQYTHRDNHNQPIVNQPRSQASAQGLCNQTKVSNHAALARTARSTRHKKRYYVPLLHSFKGRKFVLSSLLENPFIPSFFLSNVCVIEWALFSISFLCRAKANYSKVPHFYRLYSGGIISSAVTTSGAPSVWKA